MNDVYDTVFKTPDGPLHDCICLSRGMVSVAKPSC